MINETISHYKIIEKLGEGGMGVVYLAQDLKLDRQVALKFLHKHLIVDEMQKKRFIHEAKAASSLNHPNVTTIYEIDKYEGQLFIAMEYCPGQSVKELIEGEKLSLRKALEIAVQICEGLTAAHEKGVIHRDIKSANIMTTCKGWVKIMDFGLAKLRDATKLTSTGSTLGTVAYMSPEQAQAMEVDHRSDIFSFGVVLYEMITGRLPFRGDQEAAVIYSIVNKTPEPLARYKADVPEGLQRIVDKALTKDRMERYQHIDGAMADLRHEMRNLEYMKSGQIPPGTIAAKSRARSFRLIAPLAVVFITILLFFILKPFQIKFGPQQELLADENSLVVMYFENVADPEDQDQFAKMITSLLITDLSESKYMRVVSRQRLYDILKFLGKEDLKVIDKTVASEVVKRLGVRWVLTGDILQAKPNIILTADISDASTGRVLAAQRVRGEANEDLFAVVDKLSAEIKEDLPLPEQARKELDRSVADVTTHSQEAYRYYLEGVDYTYKYFSTEAEKSFKKALEYDSTFAMAYYRLAARRWNKKYLAKAVKYSDNVSQKERHYIKSLEAKVSNNYELMIAELQKIVERYPDEKEALLLLGEYYDYYLRDPEGAVRHYTKILEIDPLYEEAYNLLAHTYNKLGDLDKSIWAINKYISLAPDEPNPYDSRGDLYAYNGKLDLAIESYRKAGEAKPNFSTIKLGHMYLFKREYAKAESCYKELCSSTHKGTRLWGRLCLAYIPLYQGKFEAALQVLDEGIAADGMEQTEKWQNPIKRFLKVVIYREKDLNLAIKEFEQYFKIYIKPEPDNPIGSEYYALLLAEKGDFKKAQEVADTLRKYLEENYQIGMEAYWYAVGCIELSQGNPDESVANFEKLAEGQPEFSTWFLLAKSYLASGRLGEAVALFEKVVSVYNDEKAFYTIRAVKAHYLLGLAYEKSGWKKKAVEQYEEFLDIWKDADEGIAEVVDARARLKALKEKT